MLVGDGAPKQIRTADLLITNQLLYQLSYEGLGYSVPWAKLNTMANIKKKAAINTIPITVFINCFTVSILTHLMIIVKKICGQLLQTFSETKTTFK
tara:strand:+ start:578 stop:865 length:288 start_codon:yes stop_codon:yes gene_type:complete